MKYYSTRYESPIGGLMIVGDACGSVVGLWLLGQKYFGGAILGEVIERDDVPVLRQVRDWLDRYFAHERPAACELPLAPIGGDFRQEVWGMLGGIPYGTVATYGDIAGEIARRRGRKAMSARAVGGAVGHNPISIIVPCHRVVGSDRSLTGFAGGVDKKIWLLRHEGVCVKGLKVSVR